jgi:hypothetical protein
MGLAAATEGAVMDLDAFACEMVKGQRRVRRARVMLIIAAVALVVSVIAFASMAKAAEAHREGSIPWFMALNDDTLAQAVFECRKDLRASETPVCGNAEIAFNRLYAERLARNRFAFMQSPLFWMKNAEQAANVREACSGGRELRRSDAMLLRYCSAVSRVPMPGRRT